MGRLVVLALLLLACGDDAVAPDAALPDAAPPDAPMPDAAPIDGSPFISTGDSTILESETHLASDGAGNLVAVWIAIKSGVSNNGYALSHDHGATWSPATHLAAPGGRQSSDPVVAADSAGRFFMTWVAYNFDGSNNPTDMHVYVSRLDSGATAFGTPVEVSNPTNTTLQDKPWITIDDRDGVLVTWGDLGTPPNFTGANGIQFARSSDHGVSWARTTVASAADGKLRNLAFPCLDRAVPNAPIYVLTTAAMVSAPQVNIEVYRSADSGQSWPTTPAAPITDAVFEDPTCVAHGADLWIAYPSGNSPFNRTSTPAADSIKLVHGHDTAGVIAFDATATVASGPTGTVYLNPQLARTAGGTLEVTFYSGIPNLPATLEHAHSTDGTTWTRTALAMPGVFTLDRTARSWLGDYIGGFAADGFLYVSYADNTFQCQFATQLKCAHIAFTRTPSP